MSDFRMVAGFEDVWRPPVRPSRGRRPETVLSPASPASARARLQRIVARTPEVMVKVSGRTRDAAHLRGHLDYITRNGELEAMDQSGNRLALRRDLRDVADDWSEAAMADRRRRANTPVSHSIVLSMPAGTDPLRLHDAGSAFAARAFGDRFEYVLVLHTDTPRPHVHLAVRSLGVDGERLNPRKGDLETWRQLFAEELRERGVAAEATPRRARGVTRKAERGPVRRLRERHALGQGAVPRTLRGAYLTAAEAAFGGKTRPTVWEANLLQRQGALRRLYMAQAELMARSSDPRDQDLANKVSAFLRGMPVPESQRLALARELRTSRRERDTPVRGRTDRAR